MKTIQEDVLIVGAGPIGLAVALSAKKRGLDPLVIDAGAVVDSIARYPVGMTFFTTPELLEIGGHPFACAGEKPTREEALKYYRGVVRSEGLRVQTHARLVGVEHDVRPEDGGILCRIQGEVDSADVLCRKLVLATGYYDHPNRLGIPGEDLPHVSHYYDEGHQSFEKDVVVVGGKNSAVEAALDLFRCGARVTLVHRGPELGQSVKYWVKPDLENRIAAGEVTARFNALIRSIDERCVTVANPDGSEDAIPASRVYLLTGFQPDFDLFRAIGIKLDPETKRPQIDPETLETNVPGVYMVGSITRGKRVSEVFIENGRFDGEKVFGKLRAP
ncbi:MAG TPA: YpdA family putative bacillithiol disulfide reductase [bacterium]|nr:YpdA family putative bacillithiol disulfide reductase [bacterium]